MKKFYLFIIMSICYSNMLKAQWQLVNWNYSDTDATCLTASGINLFAGTNTKVIQLSTDFGMTWTSSGNGVTYHNGIHDLSSYNSTICAIGADNSGSNYATFISTDNGNQWNMINDPFGISGICIANDDSRLFAGAQNGVSIGSVSYGFSGHDDFMVSDYVTCLTIKDTFVYAGTSGQGIYYASTSWWVPFTSISNGLPSNSYVTCLTIDNNGGIYAGISASGLYYGQDINTPNWTHLNNGLNSLGITSIALYNDTIIFASTTDAGVYMSLNKGLNWTPVNAGLPPNCHAYQLTISGSYIFVCVQGKIYRRELIQMTDIKDANTNIISGITLFPNPSNDKIQINFPAFTLGNKGVLELLNMDGKLIKSQQIQGKSSILDVSKLPNGLYVIKIIGQDIISINKFIKN